MQPHHSSVGYFIGCDAADAGLIHVGYFENEFSVH